MLYLSLESINRRLLNIDFQTHFRIFFLQILYFIPEDVRFRHSLLAPQLHLLQLFRFNHKLTPRLSNFFFILGN
jgi:hypothetical protein